MCLAIYKGKQKFILVEYRAKTKTTTYILQNKQFHLQLKSEQKEMIQNVLERKDSMTVLPTGLGKSMCYVFPPFWTNPLFSVCRAL
jgi:superfamily II DNA helicase RecQ